MLALIDGDIFVYRAGFAAAKDESTAAVACALLKVMILNRLIYLNEIFRVEDYHIFLTSDDKSNFRFKAAKTQPYKGNRTAPKPPHYELLREYLLREMQTSMVFDQEADDQMGIVATRNPRNSLILSIDKDMRQVPCWHDEMTERAPFYVEDPGYLNIEMSAGRPKLFGTGYKFYCAQLLIGDTADNIPGLDRYGLVAAYNILHDKRTPESLDKAVLAEYKKQKCDERLEEIKTLLWIRRYENKLSKSEG